MMTGREIGHVTNGMSRLRCSVAGVVLLLGVVMLLVACGQEAGQPSSAQQGADEAVRLPTAGMEVRDAVGRAVTVPPTLDGGIVTVGSSGPLRFLSIFDVFDHVVQVDRGDVTDRKHGRGYSYAYPYHEFGAEQYHPDNSLESETVERIGARNPSLIIIQESVYHNFTENAELLATRFPVVVISRQYMDRLWNEEYQLADWYTDTVTMIGTMVGMPGRAAEHITDLNAIISDIRSLVGSNDQPVYVAGLTWQGSNELTATFPTYLPLMLVDGVNARAGDEVARVLLDPEVVTGLDISYFVMDPSSSDKLLTPDSQLVLEWLYLRNNDGNSETDVPMYVTLPMVWDSANYDAVLAGAYYLNHVLYDSLDREAVEARINGVYSAYYGERGPQVFPAMRAFFEVKSAENNVELPLLREVRVVSESGQYRIVAQ